MRAWHLSFLLAVSVLPGVSWMACEMETVNDCTSAAECQGPLPACRQWECRDNTCFPRHMDKGTDCGSGQICDGQGSCVSSCDDGERDGEETDVDCGGDSCPSCVDSQACNWAGDCENDLCVHSDDDDSSRGRCAPNLCSNNVLDSEETDVDCGGSCGQCDMGMQCARDSDCTTKSCVGGLCCSVLCAGPCHTCSTGACSTVAADTDFEDRCPGLENVCNAMGYCTLCANGAQDEVNYETDVNCGGGICDKCANGKKCKRDLDCLSCNCDSFNSLCAPTSCTNNIQDGCETAKDCGGPYCDQCTVDQTCLVKLDCLSESCENGRCVP